MLAWIVAVALGVTPEPLSPAVGFATLLGWEKGDAIRDVAVDGAGNVYVVGQTESETLPTTVGVPQPKHAASSDVFVAKIDPTGTRLLYLTYFGGGDHDTPAGIEVDAQGSAWIAGTSYFRSSYALYLPTTPDAPLPKVSRDGHYGFVARLDPTGKLLYATYVEGLGETVVAFTMDRQGALYLAGNAGPERGAHPSAPTHELLPASGQIGPRLGFVAKLAPGGRAVEFLTRFGGSQTTEVRAVAVDGRGVIHLAGTTYASDFPVTANAAQKGMRGSSDAFLLQLEPSGAKARYASFFGGSEQEEAAYMLAIDAAGSVFLGGSTRSTDLPTVEGAVQRALRGGDRGDGFVAKFDPSGALAWATYLGGPQDDSVAGLALGVRGELYVVGGTAWDFPVTEDAAQPIPGQKSGNQVEAFIARLSPDGARLEYSTYVGGSYNEGLGAVVLDDKGDLYAAGSSSSRDFPATEGALKRGAEGANDGMLVKLRFGTGAGAPPGAARLVKVPHYLIAPALSLGGAVARINAEVNVLSRSGGQLKVELVGIATCVQGACRPIVTAVEPALLSTTQITAQLAQERMAASTGLERVRWAERLVAVDGTRKEQWEALVAAYQATGTGGEGLERARATLGGTGRILWARCIEGEVGAIVFASSSPAGVKSAVGAEASEELLPEARVARWYEVRPEPRPLPPAAFAQPEVIEKDDRRTVIRLGSCPGGRLFASAPVAAFPDAPLDKRRLAAARKGAAIARARRPELKEAPFGHVGVRLCAKAQGACGGFMLLDPKGKPRALRGYPEKAKWLSVKERDKRVDPPVWVRPAFGAAGRWLGFVSWQGSEGDCEGESCGYLGIDGVWILTLDEKGGAMIEIQYDETAA